MSKIIDFAREYQPTSATKNIAELPEVSVDLDLVDDEFEFTDKLGVTKTVNQKVIEVGGEKYRVPISVIKQLQIILEDNPGLKKFKVKKVGTTKDDTYYQVIPLIA